MKRSLLLMILMLMGSSQNLFPQTPTFLKTYNRGNSGFAVRELPGNFYVAAGGTDFYYNYHWMMMSSFSTTNLHVFKTNQYGDLSWEKIYSNPNSRTLGTWMERSSDGGLIITGHNNKDVTWPPDSNDIILVKTDSNGLLLWSKIYDTGKDELGFCVRQTYDGGFILSGFHDAVPVSMLGNTYALLVKTDSSGNVTWSKKYQLPVRDFDTGEVFPCVVRQTADSGYVIVSTTSGSHQADACVIRTNAAGNMMWAKSYEHDNSMFRLSTGLDIIESSSGDFIIAGSMDKDRIINQVNYPYVLRISSTGSLVNAKLYDSNPVQMFQTGFSSIEEIAGNGFFITGMGGYGGFGTLAQFLKTDLSLTMQWSRTYSFDGVATMGSRSGRHTNDGGYVFTGKRQNTGSVLMKTDITGMVPCKIPGNLIELLPTVLVVSRTPTVDTGITASPFILSTLPVLTDTSTPCPVSISTLPVELMFFSAKAVTQDEVMLTWQTASETDNNYFIIQRSWDGINFSDIGKVNGAGTSTAVHTYSFSDQLPESRSWWYYRLMQVDENGKYSHSRAVSVRMDNGLFEMLSVKVFYEKSSVIFYFRDPGTGPVSYNLTDMLGRVVASGTLHSMAGVNQFTVEVQNLPKGIYGFNFNNGMQIIGGKFLY